MLLLVLTNRFVLLFRGKYLGVKIFFFLFFSNSLFATQIVYSEITEDVYQNNKLTITIKAHKKIENIEQDISTLFLNRKQYASKHYYYKQGSLSHSIYKISFNRMFIYGKNIYMSEVTGSFFKYTFHAEKAVIYKNRIVFSHIFFKSSDKRGSRLKFIYYFDKNNEIK